jgi:anti-sigma factor RsiW
MTTGCPQFEELSRWADGELDGQRRENIEAHVGECLTCAQITRRMATVTTPTRVMAGGNMHAPSCPGAETLVAYLTDALDAEARGAAEQHLNECDACLTALPLMRHSLARGAAAALSVPKSVQRRAMAAFGDAPAVALGHSWTRGVRQLLATARAALPSLVRIPVLVPIAVAAVAVLMIATQHDRLGVPGGMSRSLHVVQQRRVTAMQALVRAQPSSHAAVVGTLHRGDRVEVRDEERVWLRVALGNGTEGWVERDAFK